MVDFLLGCRAAKALVRASLSADTAAVRRIAVASRAPLRVAPQQYARFAKEHCNVIRETGLNVNGCAALRNALELRQGVRNAWFPLLSNARLLLGGGRKSGPWRANCRLRASPRKPYYEKDPNTVRHRLLGSFLCLVGLQHVSRLRRGRRRARRGGSGSGRLGPNPFRQRACASGAYPKR